MSFHNHMANMNPELIMHLVATAEADGIDLGDAGSRRSTTFTSSSPGGVEERVLFDHIATFWAHRDEPNVLFVHYNDMKADLEGAMRRVAGFLGIEIAEAQLAAPRGAVHVRVDEGAERRRSASSWPSSGEPKRSSTRVRTTAGGVCSPTTSSRRSSRLPPNSFRPTPPSG